MKIHHGVSRAGGFAVVEAVLGAVLGLTLLAPLPLYARVAPHNEIWAHHQFDRAERMREALNGLPADERTRKDFARVADAYRSVYFGRPTSTRADASVVALAEMQVEEGRQFNDPKLLQSAIKQYAFLRAEYPGSRFRFDALFTIAEIYKDDLNDGVLAKSTFQDYLKRYPRQRLAGEARRAILELDRAAKHNAAIASGKSKAEVKAAAVSRRQTGSPTHSIGDGINLGRNSPNSASPSQNRDAVPATSPSDVTVTTSTTTDAVSNGAAAADTIPNRSLPRVTGIRHWSTPGYTRVAVDLDGAVRYDSQRIANPDRIVIDFRGSQLASTLVGKNLDEEDGFLHRMRIAQNQPGRTRLVLEVDSLADYSAFLLPNPYRLIIDIHGREAKLEKLAHPANSVAQSAGAHGDASAEAKDSTMPRTATSDSSVTAAMDAAPQIAEVVSPRHAASKMQRESAASKMAGHRVNPSASGHQLVAEATFGTSSIHNTTAGDGDSDADANVATRTTSTEGAPGKSSAKSLGKSREKSAAHDPAVTEADDFVVADNPSSASAHARKGSRGTSDSAAHEARPTASGDRSLIRALGLKIGKIVIDAGHGGHDTGTIGPDGLREKDLVLDVALRLGKELESRLGAEVVYTRDDDTFIPLETRTAIANRERADLFISVHANSSDDESARGVETYYLNFTSSAEGLEIAARENAVSEKSIHELQDLVKKIALQEKIEESREFAADVQHSLWSGLNAKNPGLRDRGVKKAPFVVLIGANMPSILAEISFVSNPSDEKKLQTGEYRQRIAESLYKGIAKYVGGLSGVKVASSGPRREGD